METLSNCNLLDKHAFNKRKSCFMWNYKSRLFVDRIQHKKRTIYDVTEVLSANVHASLRWNCITANWMRTQNIDHKEIKIYTALIPFLGNLHDMVSRN